MVRQLAAGIFPGLFLGLAIAFGYPLTASAGPVEEIAQLAVNPADPEMMVLRYEYSGDGLFYSRDGGRSFTFVCGSAVDDPSDDAGPLIKLGPIGVSGDGKVLLGVFGGLWQDDGKGCSWTLEKDEAVVDRWVTDIVAHPSDPEVSFMITSNGGDAENGIIRRNADGSLTELGTKKAMLISRLRVVEKPDGKLRFYESGVLGQVPVEIDGGVMTTKPSYAIRVSDDDGETWTEHELGVLDGTMRLEAADPSNPDRIVVSIQRDKDTVTNTPLPDSVLVSSNMGESFEEWTEVTEFGAIAFSSDGEVWLGDSGDTTDTDAPRGILHAASLDEEPEVLTSAYPVRCLHKTRDSLFVCQRFSFGTASLEDGAFTPSFELTKLESMNQCDGIDTVAVCRQQLCTGYCGTGHFARAPMCIDAYESNEERGCKPLPPPDAGPPTGGVGGTSGGDGGDDDMDGGVTEEPAAKSSDGCTAAGGSSTGGFTWAAALVALALVARRRRALR
jgi:MYXO-CTERM domain-containing protein